jgi:indolepyruvate decarboxylase
MATSFGQMIEVNDEEVRVGYQYFYQVTLADFLTALLAKFTQPRKYSLPVVAVEKYEPAGAGQHLTYYIFFHEIGDFLKNEGLTGEVALILGESTSLYVFGNLFGLPRNSFVAQAAWGSLGHETGCALGVSIASGKRPFVVAGDGGFRMVCQELSSLAYQKCNAVVFVMSNQAYAIEQAFVDIKAFTPKGQFAPFDVLPTWDYAALAKAFGAFGYRVETVAELRKVLAEVKHLKGAPALVEVVIPQKDLAPQLARLAETPVPTRKYGRNVK